MYEKMFKFVKEYLENNDGEISTTGEFPFRKRSEHTMRVFMWAERLIDGVPNVDKEAVLVSAIFHDVGYALSSNDSKHAENSAVICEQYLKENGYKDDFVRHVTYLVTNHSNKELMTKSDTPLELILLMEADLFDESGALSIVWDCMMEGSQEEQTFNKAYEHILKYSCETMSKNPMVTAKSRELWQRKQRLTEEFVEQLSFDLGLNAANINE